MFDVPHLGDTVADATDVEVDPAVQSPGMNWGRQNSPGEFVRSALLNVDHAANGRLAKGLDFHFHPFLVTKMGTISDVPIFCHSTFGAYNGDLSFYLGDSLDQISASSDFLLLRLMENNFFARNFSIHLLRVQIDPRCSYFVMYVTVFIVMPADLNVHVAINCKPIVSVNGFGLITVDLDLCIAHDLQ